ncbi:glycosyltransferase [Corynebacterium aquilae]|uniref:glycosyltransferase n=1 Tax=Corynebacterium aquilae TaxID=203263 RepID=UPI0009518F17|nr:glycosyltransferase [Corynebacterium aquilae]
MRVLLYGDVNLNIIDGSSVWLVSIAQTLAKAGCDVTVQLKAPVENDVLVESLRKDIDSVTLLEPADGMPLTTDQAAYALDKYASTNQIDLLIVRGRRACLSVVRHSSLAEKLWAYITDLPHPVTAVRDEDLVELGEVAQSARRMFAQTEAARSYLEALVPEACGKTILLPPMIADDFYEGNRGKASGEKPVVLYSGKFARMWRTLEMLELPANAREIGLDLELKVLGSKFQDDKKCPGWATDMERNLHTLSQDSGSGVEWLGGVTRERALQEALAADIGIGWRSEELDDSLEVSTKALEYAAAGTLPVVNDTADHRVIFGDDYPGFVSATSDIRELAEVIKRLLERRNELVPRVRAAVADYSMDAAARRFRRYFARAFDEDGNLPKKKVLIVTHDAKFLGEVVDWLRGRDDVELKFDAWESLHDHDIDKSEELLEWADVVFCEWAGPALAYCSKNKKQNTVLVTRLHGFELRAPWLSSIKLREIDRCIVVSDFYAEEVKKKLPELEDRITVISNVIDASDLQRPKVGDFRFVLGMAGIVGFGKRLDRALDLLKRLRQYDSRYQLVVRGRLPWEYPWEWKDPLQRQLYLDTFARLREDSDLAEAVHFEPFGADMGSWMRRIGFILSPSVAETFHLSCAEGIASGAIPIVWDRPGAKEIFGEKAVVNTLDEAVEKVLSVRSRESFDAESESWRRYGLRWDYCSHWKEWSWALTLNS